MSSAETDPDQVGRRTSIHSSDEDQEENTTVTPPRRRRAASRVRQDVPYSYSIKFSGMMATFENGVVVNET